MSSVLNFSNFYACWFEHLRHLIEQLSSANGGDLSQLVETVMSHLADYYRVKAVAAERDPLSVFAASWASPLERSLHWVAGWRPTTSFHLIYSRSSVLFQSRLQDILRGLRNGDLADLSPLQFHSVSHLQCNTVEEENAITDELSEWQDDVSGLMRTSSEPSGRMEGLVSIIKKADDLRLRTVQKVVELLTPKQAIDFLIAAAELQFGVRGLGLNHGRQLGNIPDS